MQGNGFTIAPLQGHLFDPERTRLLNSVKLRNHVLQRVIELMSLSRGSSGKNSRRGRISYATLGINQLGAVYEALLSFRGFFAEEDLYEVRRDPKAKKASSSEEDETEIPDDSDATDDDDTPSPSAREKRKDAELDPLEAAYFVPASAIGQYTDAERLFGGEPRLYPKGRFIYRLAGRARENPPATTPRKSLPAVWWNTPCAKSCLANPPTTSCTSPSANPPWAARPS